MKGQKISIGVEPPHHIARPQRKPSRKQAATIKLPLGN
jgi:hypothetical protein